MDNSSDKTHIVAQKKPNALGLYDMSGNVREWCQDWFGSYSAEAQTDHQGSSSGTQRVFRGGSWFEVADCRASARSHSNPAYTINTLGLRLAR